MSTIQISALPAASAITADDLLPIEHDPSGTPVTQKATAAQVATTVRAVAGAYVTTNIVPSGATSLTVNATQADVDVRIKGDTDAALVFLDAGTNRVGIGTATPTTLLDVSGTLKATAFTGSGASLTGIVGTASSFQSLASDPAPLTAGDVWYNTTTGTFKCCIAQGPLVWAAATAYPVQPSSDISSNIGSASSLLSVGGFQNPPGTALTSCYTFNGTSWSAVASTSAVRRNSATGGTASAAVVGTGRDAAGNVITSAELWNGSAWSSTGSVVSGQAYMTSGGTSTASFFCGGLNPAASTGTQTFNGSTWSTSGALSTGRQGNRGGGGTQSAGLTYGGYSGATNYTSTELFNGSTWSSSGSLGTLSGDVSGCAQSQSTALAMGLATTVIEKFSGSTWSTTTALPVNGNVGASAGSSSSATVWQVTGAACYTSTSPAAAKTFTQT